MDDKEKSFFESVTDTIKNTLDIASDAAKKALEPEPLKPDEEVVVIPAPVGADFTSPMPPMVVVVKKKTRKKPVVNTSGRITPAYDIPIPDTPLPASKKAAKKASRKPAKKVAKKAVKKSAAKKSAKKTAKRPSRKSKSKFAAKKNTTKKAAKKKKAKKSKR